MTNRIFGSLLAKPLSGDDRGLSFEGMTCSSRQIVTSVRLGVGDMHPFSATRSLVILAMPDTREGLHAGATVNSSIVRVLISSAVRRKTVLLREAVLRIPRPPWLAQFLCRHISRSRSYHGPLVSTCVDILLSKSHNGCFRLELAASTREKKGPALFGPQSNGLWIKGLF